MKQHQSFQAMFVFSPAYIEFLDEKQEIKQQWPYNYSFKGGEMG